MKVLLIDDDYPLVDWMFGDVSAEFFFAENEEEAMSLISENDFDAILMDGNLQEAHGHEVVSRMREKGIMTKIVMFSSEDEQNDLGIKAGANAVLNKKDFHKYFKNDELNKKLTDIFKKTPR